MNYSSRLTFEEQDGQAAVKELIEMDDPSDISKLLSGWMKAGPFWAWWRRLTGSGWGVRLNKYSFG